MNSMATWYLTGAATLLMTGVGVKLAADARQPHGTDVEQIRNIIRVGAEAANHRDPAGIGKLLSPHYRDTLGMSQGSLRYEINDFFRRHTSVQVTVPEESFHVDIQPDGSTASVSFHAAVTAQLSDSRDTMELDPVLRVEKEKVRYYLFFPGQEWKIVSAENYGGMENL